VTDGIVSSSKQYSDTYLIYIDKLGTTYEIEEKDSVYGNSKGLCKLATMYLESNEVLKKHFNEEVLFFGFSDTVIALPLINKPELIAKTVCNIFFKLLQYQIYTRIFVTKGDFSFHKIDDLEKSQNAFICPIYGTALLDAYKLDSKSYTTIGPFIQNNASDNINLVEKATFLSGNNVSLINLKSYLSEEHVEEVHRLITGIINGPDEYMKQFEESSKYYSELFSGQNNRINEQEIRELINEVRGQKESERKSLLKSLTTLKSILDEEKTIIYDKTTK
jgi:uncharacterized protein YneF (UPF0154 family)